MKYDHMKNVPYQLFTPEAERLCEKEKMERREAKEHYIKGIQGVDGGPFPSKGQYQR